MTTPPANDSTTLARTGVRRTRWPAVLASVGSAFTVGVLGAAGLAPLLSGLGTGTLAAPSAVEWLTSMGMNALAGWVGNLAADGLRAPFAGDETPKCSLDRGAHGTPRARITQRAALFVFGIISVKMTDRRLRHRGAAPPCGSTGYIA